MLYETPEAAVEFWDSVVGASQGGPIPLPDDTFPED